MSLYTFLYKGQVYDTVTVDNVASAVHSSVTAVAEPVLPPKIIDLAAVAPPDEALLAVETSFSSVQLVPFQNSVFALKGGPESPETSKALPLSNPDIEPSRLVVFISATSDQEVPSQVSTFDMLGSPLPADIDEV